MILISAHGLGRQYAGDPIFADLAFEVRAGERIGLVGTNGAGKTTLLRLLGRVAREQPGWWVAVFRNLEERRSSLRDGTLADELFVQGNRGINNNDIPTLKAAVQQLLTLLPVEQRAQVQSRSTVVK